MRISLLFFTLLTNLTIAFSQNPILFFNGDSYGYTNTSGKVVIKPKYSRAEGFSNGTAIVNEGDDYYVINAKGRKLHKNGLVHAIRVGGAFVACDDGEWNIIDAKGKSIYHFELDNISFYWDNMDYIFIYEDEKFGSNVYLNVITGKTQTEVPASN